VKLETLDPMDHLVLRGKKVLLDIKVQLVLLGFQDNVVHLVLLELREQEEILDYQDQKDKLGKWETEEYRELQVHQVLPVTLEALETQVPLVPLEKWVPLA